MKGKINQQELNRIATETLELPENLKKKIIPTIIKNGDVGALIILAKIVNIPEVVNTRKVFELVWPLMTNDKNIRIITYLIEKLKFDVTKEKNDIGDNLLSHACRYGALNISKTLIENKFNINHKNDERYTLLHIAIEQNQLEIIKLLCDSGAKLHEKDNQGWAPLHFSVLAHYDEGTNILIKAGANRKQKCNYMDYNILKKSVNDPRVQKEADKRMIKKITPPELENELIDPFILTFLQCQANFFKGLFATSKNENFFKESINLGNKVLKSHNHKLQGKHIDIILTILTILNNINNILIFEGSQRLQDTIIEIATKFDKKEEIAKLYNNTCVKYLSIGDYVNAIKFSQLGYETIKNNKSFQFSGALRFKILLNLSKSIARYDVNIAVEYLEEAEEFLNDNLTLLEPFLIDKCLIYIRQIRLDKVLETAVRFPDKEYGDLTILSATLNLVHSSSLNLSENYIQQLLEKYKFNNFNPDKLKNSPQKNGLYIDIIAKLKEIKGDFASAIDLQKSMIQKDELGENVVTTLVKILSIYHSAEQWQEGLIFLQEARQEFPEIIENNITLTFRYLEFLFYEENKITDKANEILQILKVEANLGEEARSVYNIAHSIRLYGDINTDLSNINKEALPAKEQFLIKRLEEVKNQEEVKIKENVNDKDEIIEKKEVKQQDQKNSEELKENEQNNITLVEWASEPDEYDMFNDMSGKEINQYFENKKRELIKLKVQNMNLPENYSWVVKDTAYSSSNKEEIYNLDSKPNFYVTFDSAIIPRELLPQFKFAIQKGEVSKKYGSIGIKFIPHKACELKINGGERLYTTEVYKNEENKFLIIFDKYEHNHGKMDKIINSSKIKTIPVKSISFDNEYLHDLNIHVSDNHSYSNETNIIGEDYLGDE